MGRKEAAAQAHMDGRKAQKERTVKGMYNIAYPNLRAEFGRQALHVSGVAQRLGIPRARLSRALSGETEIPLKLAFELRDRYFPGQSLEYLFGERE